MILKKATTIPRYNWDYRFHDFVRALASLTRDSVELEGILETVIEKYFGHVPILTTSGRASLWAILKSMNLREGARIGVPLFCCPVVFEVIAKAGFVPEFLDIREDDYTVSPEDIETKRHSLSAVIVVHMFGNPANMDEVAAACKNIPVIEDCAQALLSKKNGQYLGFRSEACFYSFRSGKYISAGEGSAIFCRDETLFSLVKRTTSSYNAWSLPAEARHSMSTYGKSLFYRRPLYGLIGRSLGAQLDQMLNLTAKSGIALKRIAGTDSRIIADKLAGFHSKVEQQRKNALRMIEQLSSLGISLPIEKDQCVNNYYQFVIRFSSTYERDYMCYRLADSGIDTAKYLDDVVETATMDYGYTGGCPISEKCSQTILSIPHYYTLSGEVDMISSALIEANRSYINDRNAVSKYMSSNVRIERDGTEH